MLLLYVNDCAVFQLFGEVCDQIDAGSDDLHDESVSQSGIFQKVSSPLSDYVANGFRPKYRKIKYQRTKYLEVKIPDLNNDA